MSKKEKYEAKAEAHSAIVDLITGALENGEFKDLSELELKHVGRILKQMERAVERNQAYAINPPAPKPKKPVQSRKGRVTEIKADTTEVNWQVTKRKRGNR